MSQEQTSTATVEKPPETSKSDAPAPAQDPKVQAAAPPAPKDQAADLASLQALIDAAVSEKTKGFVEEAQVVQLARSKNLSVSAAAAVIAAQKAHPTMSPDEALAWAKIKSPNEFATASRGFSLLPVAPGESSLRDKTPEKTNEQKYEEAIDYANNGANANKAAAKGVMRDAVAQFLGLQIQKHRGVLVQ